MTPSAPREENRTSTDHERHPAPRVTRVQVESSVSSDEGPATLGQGKPVSLCTIGATRPTELGPHLCSRTSQTKIVRWFGLVDVGIFFCKT